jgi:RHS repeat-associated protein
MPFGEDLGAGQFGRMTAQGYEPSGTPSNPREKFATYERDDETGLDFAQARYYQNRLGRFTSVDPENAGAEAEDPQTWNAYAYALNNPLRYSDPDGLKVRVTDLNGNEQILSDQEAKDGLFNKDYQKSLGGEVKDGKIYSNGELVGTYERISFDDQSPQFNQLMFGNRFEPGLVARAPVMNQAIGVFAAGTFAVGATGGAGLYAYTSTAAASTTSIVPNLTQMYRASRLASQALKSTPQQKLLQNLFGNGVQSATTRLAQLRTQPGIPKGLEGLTKEAVQNYMKIAEYQIARGSDVAGRNAGVQAARLEVLREILKRIN